MKEGAARTSGPLFLYNVSELEKVPLTGPLARFPQGVEVGDVLSAYPGQIFHQPLSVPELIL